MLRIFETIDTKLKGLKGDLHVEYRKVATKVEMMDINKETKYVNDRVKYQTSDKKEIRRKKIAEQVDMVKEISSDLFTKKQYGKIEGDIIYPESEEENEITKLELEIETEKNNHVEKMKKLEELLEKSMNQLEKDKVADKIVDNKIEELVELVETSIRHEEEKYTTLEDNIVELIESDDNNIPNIKSEFININKAVGTLREIYKLSNKKIKKLFKNESLIFTNDEEGCIYTLVLTENNTITVSKKYTETNKEVLEIFLFNKEGLEEYTKCR